MWLVVLGLIVAYYTLRYLCELVKLPNLSKRAVFITGADTGFGRLLALKCAKNNIPTFAGCLTEQGKISLKKEAPQVHAIQLDVRSDHSVQFAADYVREHLTEGEYLWAVVNNAGITHRGLDAWLDLSEYKEVVDINLFGIIRVTHAFLPMLKKSKGRIVAISSVCGRSAPAAAAAYCVSKYGTEAYMDSIRRELRPFGIRCSILEPGSFKTGIITAENIKRREEDRWAKLPLELKEEYGEKFKDQLIRDLYEKWATTATDNVDEVVDCYYHAITARWPRNRYRCGWDTVLIRIPMTLLPTEIEDFCMRWLLGSDNKPAVLEKSKSKGS